MNLDQIKDLKKGLAQRKIGDELVLVPLQGNVADLNEMFTLNELAAFVWERIEEVESTADMVKQITSEFEVESETAAKDLDEFLKDLSKQFS